VSEEPERYQLLRSHADVHVFVICYAERFHELPENIRRKGPWRGTLGDVSKLKPELRLALAQGGYVLVHCEEAMFNPEA
jgi:hypothetical protein